MTSSIFKYSKSIFIIILILATILPSFFVFAYPTYIEPDTPGITGRNSAIITTTSEIAFVAYYDFSDDSVNLLTCGNVRCNSGNTITTIESFGNLTPEGWGISITLDSAGLFPIISYYNQNTSDLKLIVCDDVICAGDTPITIASTGVVGVASKVMVNSSNFPVITYTDSTNADLRIYICSDAPCTGGTDVLLDSTGGGSVSMDLDVLDAPVVTHFDSNTGIYRIARCSDDVCTAVATHEIADVGTSYVNGYSSIYLETLSGFPYISYYDGPNGDLFLLMCGDDECDPASANETTVLIDGADTDAGTFNSLLVMSATGEPNIAYYDRDEGSLKLAECSNSVCASIDIVSIDIPHSPSVANFFGLNSTWRDPSTTVFPPIISYYTNIQGNLRLYFETDIEFDDIDGSIDVEEGGATDTFTLNLTSAPAADVTVYLYSADGETTFTPVSVIFPAGAGALTPQTITVAAINDNNVEGDHVDYLNFYMTSDDDEFDQFAGTHALTINIEDDDCVGGGCNYTTPPGNNAIRRLLANKKRRLIPEDKIPAIMCPYFTDFMRKGDRDYVRGKRDVGRLQVFLTDKGFNPTWIDGIFGIRTERAVRSWQAAFANDVLSVWSKFLKPTGYFYQASRHVANKQMGCPSTTLLDNGVLLQ